MSKFVCSDDDLDQNQEMIEVCTCGEEGCECPFSCKIDADCETLVSEEMVIEETTVEQPIEE